MGAEDAQMVVESQAQTGVEPTYCMGDDIPLAVLSDKPHMLYNYFKQRFAQVRFRIVGPATVIVRQWASHGTLCHQCLQAPELCLNLRTAPGSGLCKSAGPVGSNSCATASVQGMVTDAPFTPALPR